MITISKTEFEHALYVATSSTMRIYEGVEPYIDYAIRLTTTNILGNAITDEVMDGNTMLSDCIKRHVAFTAFLNVFRQLDLVLTPTGFGVVSDERTVPASSQRVDALETQVRLERERNYGTLLQLLRQVEDWGTQPQAAYCIRTPLFDFNELETRLGRPATLEEWANMQKSALEVELRIIGLISRSQWNDIMAHVRSYDISQDVYNDAATYIIDQSFYHALLSPAERDSETFFLDFIEANIETFSLYKDSREYQANHYERYQNTKDSAAFIFAG